MHKEYLWEGRKKSPLGKQRNRFVDNIKIDFREIGWYGAERTDFDLDRTNGRIF